MNSRDTHCDLIILGNSLHIEQIVTGFCELAAAGVISLRLHPYRGPKRESLVVRALINGQRVVYDEHDGPNPPDEIKRELNGVAHYFKRSLDPTRAGAWPASCHLWPLGLNYVVTSRRNSWHWGTRPLHLRRASEALVRSASVVTRHAGFTDHRILDIRDYEWLPVPCSKPTVLFMTKAWPWDESSSDYTIEDRVKVNDLRAECIRAARREFGSRFYGGFAATEFARREYGDCLVPEGEGKQTVEVLQRARDAAVCVTTTGLHGAIGWKMAEYVAASRAIVSTRLTAVIPGGFSAGVNYLDFETTDEFVCAVDRLLSDADLRLAMMQANWAYYNSWVRPDALVLNTLLTVLGHPVRGESGAPQSTR